MANGHGGYRPPAKPAPVSGPGAHSRRTDGGPAQSISAAPDQAYGAMKEQQDAQRIAPMGGATPMPHAAAVPQGGGEVQLPPYTGSPFGAPTARPNEPITHGVDIGPGAGPEALAQFQPVQQAAGSGQMTQLLQKYAATDTTGILAQLMQAAAARNA